MDMLVEVEVPVDAVEDMEGRCRKVEERGEGA